MRKSDHTNIKSVIFVLKNVRTGMEVRRTRAMIGATIEAYQEQGKDTSTLKEAQQVLFRLKAKPTRPQVRRLADEAIAILQ